MPTTKTTRPLRCAKCGATGDTLTVERDRDYVQRAGKRRLAATVICTRENRRWSSVHPEAIERSQAADA